MRLLSRVGSLVGKEVGPHVEGFPATGTSVRFLPGVSFLLSEKVFSPDEDFAIMGTLVGSLANSLPWVIPQL